MTNILTDIIYTDVGVSFSEDVLSFAEFWWGNPRERVHFEVLGVKTRIILNGS
jgi:hypothetical protein